MKKEFNGLQLIPIKTVFKWLLISRLRMLRLETHPSFSTNEKENQNRSCLAHTCDFSLAMDKLQVIARNSNFIFISPFAPVVICRSNYLGIGFKQ